MLLGVYTVRRNYRGYGSYHGRSSFRRFLKVLAVILLVIVILAAAAFLYLQQFIVISADGVRLELPFLQPEEPSPEPSSQSTPPVVLPTPTPTPEPTPEPEPEAMDPVVMPAEALTDGSALHRLADAGGDCALFDMKTDVTDLNFTSAAQPIAQSVYNPQTPGLNDAIRAMNQAEGLYTVARVSCFKDAYIFLYNDTFPIRTNGGYCWTGPDTLMWISPTNPAVQDYLIQICVELAQLGFDEILLDNAGYPSEGNLGYIRYGDAYDPAQFSTVIGNFYTKTAAALEEYHVKLSVVTTQAALDGTDALTGQTPDNLALFSRLWMVDDTGVLQPLESARND